MSWKLRKKAEALLAQERGAVRKDPGGRASVCLVYPNTYFVGMSNLGFQSVYGMINRRDDALCERAFLPDEDDISEYSRTGARLFSLESGRPVAEFDILAFSVSFENDYVNVLEILKLAGMPVLSSGRAGGRFPLVIAGGVCAFTNPEPLAEIMDAFLIGEAEGMIEEFMDAFVPDKHGNNIDLLKKLSKIEGVYVPSFYEVEYSDDGWVKNRTPLHGAPEVVRTRKVKELSASSASHCILTPETEFSGMRLIEAMRGCPWSCNFCLAGHIYNPPRMKPLEALRLEIEAARAEGGRAGLIGPSLSDYKYADDALSIEGVDFSITSLRASPKSAGLVGHLKGHKSVSIAPEAGTGRLRRVVNKKITESDILETCRLVFGLGIERLRLYFMLGLPTETDEDARGIAELVSKIRALSKRGGISITLSVFVPKPFTPFSWHPMAGAEDVKRRMSIIKKETRNIWNVRILHDVPKYAYLQGLLSMGDRRLSGFLLKYSELKDMKKAASASGIEPDYYIFRQKSSAERFPWDFIDNGIKKEDLLSAYEKALHED